MKIINKTDYDTQYLRRLFIACEKHEGTNYKYREVEVLKSKRGRVHGRAWYNSRYVTMYLPNTTSIHAIAKVYIHEVGHNIGLHHKDMTYIGNIDTSWLPYENAPFPPKKPKQPKSKPNIIEVKANHAQKKLDEWTKKFARAKTFIKKYRAKVKYYEKKKAASPKVENKGTLPLK